MPNPGTPHKSAGFGARVLRSLNPLRMPGYVISTFDTSSIKRDVEWVKAGHAALWSDASDAGLPLIRGAAGEIDVEASTESVRRHATAAHEAGHLPEEAFQEILRMTPQTFRAWRDLQAESARRRSEFYCLLAGIAGLVAVWSVLVVSNARIGLLAGVTWLLLALLVALYGWRERRESQGRAWLPITELKAVLFR